MGGIWSVKRRKNLCRLCAFVRLAGVPATHPYFEKYQDTTASSEQSAVPPHRFLRRSSPPPQRNGTAGVKKSENSRFFLTGRQFESRSFAGALMAFARGGVAPPPRASPRSRHGDSSGTRGIWLTPQDRRSYSGDSLGGNYPSVVESVRAGRRFPCDSARHRESIQCLRCEAASQATQDHPGFQWQDRSCHDRRHHSRRHRDR